ncbi:MAG: single-stranded DNA-binding protein [Clostridiales bacterium]|jgi:single-stranded DNA-binding protein|nr:single-stranded DNA-binding protein [Clostridiales bacterium]
MNRVILSGNVVRDAEVGDTANGSKRCSFSLAVSGNADRPTVFVPVVAWGNFAEPVAKYAKKGARLLVEGELVMLKASLSYGRSKKPTAKRA